MSSRACGRASRVAARSCPTGVSISCGAAIGWSSPVRRPGRRAAASRGLRCSVCASGSAWRGGVGPAGGRVPRCRGAVGRRLGTGVEERVAGAGCSRCWPRCGRGGAPVDPLARAAALAMALPGARVDALDLGVSERQLRRRFVDAVGYWPKTLGAGAALPAVPALRTGSLVERAFAAGYADQAHLTRECRRLSGPDAGRARRSGAGAAGERVRFVQAAGAVDCVPCA